jgi:hypothetical protein
MSSIYVAIPSMRDPEYFNTIQSCYKQSSGKNEIHIGTAYNVLFNNKKIIEDVRKNLPDIPNLNIKFINTNKNRGVGFGRLESMSFYDGQDYFLQCDSHTLFLENWDEILIDAINEAKQYMSMNKIVLTGYAWPYSLISKNERVAKDNRTAPMYPYYACKEDPQYSHVQSWRSFDQRTFNAYNLIPKWVTSHDINDNSFVKNKFELCTKINANFLFAEKEFVKNYKKLFPWEFLFFEEEFIMTIESFKMGWAPVFPNFDINICHLYGNDYNEFYPGRESLNMTDKDCDVAKSKIIKYFKDNKEYIDKYFKYASIDEETKKSTKIRYIPSVEDLFCGN